MDDLTSQQAPPSAPEPAPAPQMTTLPPSPLTPPPGTGHGKAIKIIAGILVIIIIAGIAYFLLSGGLSSVYTSTIATTTASGQTSQGTPIWITDPSQVPSGTTELLIDYSNIMVHTTSPSSGWVSAQGSGVINFTGLSGSGVLLGFVNISSSAQVDMASFSVSGAKIVVNGTSYNLTLSNSTATAQVVGSSAVTPSMGILIDAAPNITVSSQSPVGYTMSLSSSKVIIVATSEVQQPTDMVNSAVGFNASLIAQLNNLV